jgi:hypothetical protein
MEKLDRDKTKFVEFIERQIKFVQRQILDLAEVSIPPDNWKVMRSKILGITNDLRRDIEQELDKNYALKYSPDVIYEDIVQVRPNRNLKERIKYGTGETESN